jgi:RecB family endonuclease NucS
MKAKAAGRRAAPRVVPPAIKLGITEIRTLVTEQPDLVEAGLRLFSDGGVPGVSFGTPVGEIDLLARDAAGALVLLMVTSSAAAKDLLSELLPRIGYVRKHLAQPGQEVRAIVLLERLPEEVQYAAAALADTVSFKTYRLALNFDDIAL